MLLPSGVLGLSGLSPPYGSPPRPKSVAFGGGRAVAKLINWASAALPESSVNSDFVETSIKNEFLGKSGKQSAVL